jgi:di/tricarboxylate transporter
VSPAIASLLALLTAIGLSMTTRINVGLVAMALAWIVGRYVAGLSADVIVRGFPTPLFLALTGVTLLFASAEVNGTLERLAERAVRLARGSARVVPLVFFGNAWYPRSDPARCRPSRCLRRSRWPRPRASACRRF